MRAISLRPLVSAPVLIASASVGLAATLDGEDGQTFCIFRLCTGGYCPGCGGSRAAAALVRGDLMRSWDLNPWVPLLALQLGVALFALARFGLDRMRPALVPVLVANLVLGLTLWSIRLASGAIPVPFG